LNAFVDESHAFITVLTAENLRISTGNHVCVNHSAFLVRVHAAMAAVSENESASSAAAADAAARALETLHGIVRTWLRDEPFHLYVAGSYRLGTLPIGDIDVVLVVRAATVPRARIFTDLCGILQSHSSVTQLTAVPRARVPLLGFFIDGQEFDLLTCHLCVPRDAPWPSREHILESYAALNGADDASVIALSGARVTEWLCSRLLTHFAVFRDAVQTLRAWAKRRALYSNKSGFLGGINLVLLAAVSVVQLTRSRSTHVILTSSAVVAHTFKLCATRKWGARTPPLEIDGEYERRNDTCPVFLYALDWDAHAATATDAMVLLTPCFPRTNSLYAVTSHTATVLRHEFRRAHAVQCGHDLAPLAAPLVEMQTCTRVLCVTITAPCHSTGRQWLGYMQAQIRHVMRYVHEQATQLGIRAFRHIHAGMIRRRRRRHRHHQRQRRRCQRRQSQSLSPWIRWVQVLVQVPVQVHIHIRIAAALPVSKPSWSTLCASTPPRGLCGRRALAFTRSWCQRRVFQTQSSQRR
jgi:hypothetical protein